MTSAAAAGPQRLLVPLDGSSASRRALAYAIGHARRLKAELVALHVITPFELAIHVNPRPAIATAAEFERRARLVSERILAAAGKAAGTGRVRWRVLTIWDTAVADAVLRTARRERCGLIVLGSHGRTGLQRMLLGSVTQKVLARSRVPVLIVR